MRALPDRVALGSFSTELGDVKMCLYALDISQHINHKVKSNGDLLIPEANFGKAHSKGPLCRSYTHGREISAIDPLILPAPRYAVFPWS
jgi:hypothetical protein